MLSAKKEELFLRLFSEKPRKNLHLTQKTFENFCSLVKKTKTIFASSKKLNQNLYHAKNAELISALVLKITNLFVENLLI